MREAYLLLLSFVCNLAFAQLSVPTKCVVVAGNEMATISFEVPFTQFINNTITYEVQINNNTNYVLCSGSPCTVTNLTNGQSYTFKIRAKENATYSAWSESTAAAMPSSIAPDATYAYSNLKQVALQMAQTRVNLASNAGFSTEATTLLAEIQQLQSQTIPVPATPYYGVGFFPKAIVNNSSNPYYVSLHNWAANYLNQPFTNYSKASTTNFVFTNTGEARNISIDLFRLYWLLVSPDSNYRFHPELFKRYLNIIYATSDDYEINGGYALNIPGSTPNQLDDWFAQYGVVYGWRMGLFSFKELIPQSLQNKIVAATNIMGAAVYNKAQSVLTDSGYVNRDVSYAETLLNCGLLSKNAAWYNFSNQIVTMTNSTEVYPDGAFSYIWNQNEGTNYHGGNNQSIARIYNISENQTVKSILESVANFELISTEPGFVPEFYTCPSWKMQWNTGTGYSGDFLGYLNSNPYYKTLINSYNSAYGYSADLNNYVFYNTSLQPKPLLNNYLVYDRNIQGLRARYDDFSYAITMRNISIPNNLGHQTLAGSMTTEHISGQRRDIHSGLMAAYAKVHTETGTTSEWDNWAYLINNITPKVALSTTIGSISTTGDLYKAAGGPSSSSRNWQTFQEWLTLPDRMIGLIEVFPKNNTAELAYEVDIRYRFGHGINAFGGLYNPQTMVTNTAGQQYTYGKYKIKVITHNCEQVFTAASGINRDVGPGTEVVFRNGSYNTGTKTSYPANYRKYALVEISKGIVPNLSITRFSNNGVIGIVASGSNNKYAVFRNTTSSSKTVTISDALLAGVTSKVHFPRTDSPGLVPSVLSGSTISIPANEHRLIITSNNEQDQAASWTNFNQMQEELPAITISGNDLDYIISNGQNVNFTALTNNLGNNTTYQWQINGSNVGTNLSAFHSNTLANNDKITCVLTTTLPNGSVYSVISNVINITTSTTAPLEINYEQNAAKIVSIGTLNPNRSSTLHVDSNDKGILIPRLAGTAIESMNNPAEGLLVYAISSGNSSITATGFWYYSQGQWVYTKKDSDLYNINSTLSNDRVISMVDNNLTLNSTTGKLSIDGNLENQAAVYRKAFRMLAISPAISWLDDDCGVILPPGYVGAIILPDAVANSNRIIAVKNVSGNTINFQNVTGSAVGIYANENINNMPNKTVRWFISDGSSWRIYK